MTATAMPLFSNAVPPAPGPPPGPRQPLWSQPAPVLDELEELRATVAVLERSPANPMNRASPTTTVPNAPAEAPRAPTRESGYATSGQSGSFWGYSEEDNPDLQWPQCVGTYDRMRRTDAQVTSVLRAVTLPVRRTRWYIEPNGAPDDVVQHVARDLGLPVAGSEAAPPAERSRDRFSWSQHLVEVMEMLTFGHAFFEQQLRVEEDGWAHLRKLGLRPADTIDQINVAPDGGLESIRQRARGQSTGGRTTLSRDATQGPVIPVSKLVAYVYDRVGGDWRGRSLLRPAYKHWLLKDDNLRIQTGTFRRNGMGVPLYVGADGEEENDPDLSRGRNLAQQWAWGNTAGGSIPYGALMKLLGVEGNLPDLQPSIEYHDSQIARAVLAHFLNLGTQTGSWALGSTFADFFTLSLQTLAESIRDIATQHVIEDLVDVNWGPSMPAPRLAFDEIGSRQTATAQAVKILVDAGIVVPDENLERAMREQLGLPGRGGATLVTPASETAPTPGQE